MTAENPNSDQAQNIKSCPACNASLDSNASFCPACGRSLNTNPPDVDIAGWIQSGWKLFANNIAIAIGLPLIVILPAFALAILGYFGMIFSFMLFDPSFGASTEVQIIVLSIVAFVILLFAATMPALYAGIYACFLDGLRSGQMKAARFWAGFHRWWSCSWVVWVLSALSFACMPFVIILIGIPLSIALSTMIWLALFRIVDKDVGGFQALNFAVDVMRGRFWMLLLYTFLINILMSAGCMGMYIGVVATVPIGIASLAAAYDSLSKKYEASSNQ